jgi:ElaB/YqjD/DUF883 family membrane-anchored ribosome-binding protein
MAFSILSDDTRAKLEQERSRLIDERDAIVQAAVAQATADVDQLLQQLNQLLGDDMTASAEENGTAKTSIRSNLKQSKSSTRTTNKESAATIQDVTTEESTAHAAKEEEMLAPPSAKAKAKSARKASSSESKPSASAQLSLKQEFQSVTPTEAVNQIMKRASKPMTTDEVIPLLYQSVKEADLSTARKSVALILGRGTHQGIYEKVQENPSGYQLRA